MLAKVYAEKPLRDYAKVIKYADELAADGFDLVEDFSDLWAYDTEKKRLPGTQYQGGNSRSPLSSRLRQLVYLDVRP